MLEAYVIHTWIAQQLQPIHLLVVDAPTLISQKDVTSCLQTMNTKNLFQL